MSARNYTVYVYKSTATDTSTSHVAFTLTGTRLVDAPTVRRPLVRPLYGRSESQPWYVDVLDVGSSFSALLASSGRYDKMGRLVQVRRATDSSTAVKIGTGRITNVELLEDVAAYRVTCDDERTVERQTALFTSNTTRLFPAGVHAQYGPFAPPPGVRHDLRASTASAKWRRISWTIFSQALSDAVYAALSEDLQPGVDETDYDAAIRTASTTKGLFRFARVRIGSVDYPIRNFPAPPDLDYDDYVQDPLAGIDYVLGQGQGRNPPLVAWIAASSTVSTAGTNAFLHMMGAPPSPLTPLHIGGRNGQTLASLIADVYDGDYSSSGAMRPRYSTASLDALPKDVRVRYRITEPNQDMSQWLEDHVFMPHGLVPSVNSDGQIIVKQTFWPGSTSSITYTYTGANLAQHPTWRHEGREQITSVRVRYTVESYITARSRVLGSNSPKSAKLTEQLGEPFSDLGGSADRILAKEVTFTVDHDLSTKFRPKVLDVSGFGWHRSNTPNPVNADTDQVAIKYGTKYAREMLNRFGDAPVYGSLVGLTSAESIEPGDWVKVTLASYPNASVPGRGNSRFVQVFGRTDEPSGPTHDYLDGGPANNPLTSPSVTLSTSTADARHQLRGTIGSVTAGGYAEAQIAAGSTQPAATSTKWTPSFIRQTSGISEINARAAGTKYWLRARNQKQNRLPSAWVVSTGKTTASLTAPSALATTSIFGVGFTGVWTIGTVGYPTEFFIDTSTSATLSTANLLIRLPPGTRRYRVDGGLSLGTKYGWGVRHVDLFGGASTAVKASVTTTTVAPTAPTMLGLDLLLTGPYA